MQHSGYRFEAASVQGFIEQVQRYAASRHYFYFFGEIPASKDPPRVDTKLLSLYGIARPDWQRKTRYLLRDPENNAGIHYLRYERSFVIMATPGRHRFRRDHGDQVRDLRRIPLKFHGYSLRNMFDGARGRRTTCVRLDKPLYQTLRANLQWLGTRPEFRAPERLEVELARELRRMGVLPFAGVQDQLQQLLGEVNQLRRRAGFRKIGSAWIPRRRRKAKVFVECRDAGGTGRPAA